MGTVAPGGKGGGRRFRSRARSTGSATDADPNVLQQAGTRVALDMTTLTIMRYLPREVDPLVYNMTHEDPGNVTYSSIGGICPLFISLSLSFSCLPLVCGSAIQIYVLAM